MQIPRPTVPSLDRAALIAVLATPPLLLHAHGFAEATIAIAGLCLLARSHVARDWAWARTPWLLIAWAWWGWLTLCSLPLPAIGLGEGGFPSFLQAVLTVRFLLLAAAMEHVVLRDPAPRRWLFGIMAASTLYIAGHSVIQFLFGRSLYGAPLAFGDTLTGPFGKPRAGPPLARIMIPTLIPAVAALLDKSGIRPKVGAYALLLAGLGVVILIGQRMPLALAAGGLVVSALLLRKLRPLVLIAGVLSILLIAALPIVSPPTYQRLVVRTTAQLAGFPASHYGLLYTRALAIGVQNPVTGLGFDGFGTGCPNPRYFQPSLDGGEPDGGGATICWVHPHNFYIQALTDAGFAGLALFCAMVLGWLRPLARGLWRDPDPIRVGLFATMAVQMFPIQSSNAFTSLPMGGWLFMLLGWALAESRASGPIPMKAAVVQPLPGIGDMIWHLPHIRAIAAHVGEPVTLLAKPRSAADQIFGAETTVRDVMWLDRNPENRRGEHDGGGGFLRVARALRARQFGAVYLLHHSRTIAAQLMAAGIPARFGYGVGTQRLFLNRRPFLTPAEARRHPFEQATAWLAAAGIPMDQAEPVLPAAARARHAVRARLGAGGAPLVTIGIGSSEPYKQWGAARFAALANGLAAMGFQHLVLVGGNAERALAEEIRALANPAISLAIGWNLGDIAALFAESLFYVGNDTGVMNMAAAVGIPAYCLFGATPPFFHSRRIVPVTPPGGVDRAEGMARITPDAVLRVIAAGVIAGPDAGRSTPPPAAGPH